MYLKDLIVSYYPNTTLHSQAAGLLVVPGVSKRRIGGSEQERVFPRDMQIDFWCTLDLRQCSAKRNGQNLMIRKFIVDYKERAQMKINECVKYYKTLQVTEVFYRTGR